MNKTAYSLLMLVFVTQVTYAGPIYTWQDESGQIHYSDRPLAGEQQSQPMDLQTRVDGASDPEITKQYSIREQIEYFDRKRELQRRVLLEERRLRQDARDQELAQRQLEYERQRLENPQPETVIINQYPRYRPINRHGRFRQPRGVQVHNPYMLQYEHLGDHHRFNLDVGRPYPSYPLNFWKH